jgi:chromosome partitioning protein
MNCIFIINPKGGSGKSTMAIHTAIGLLTLQYNVLFIDCDIDQLTSYNFFENRKNFIYKSSLNLSQLTYLKLSIENLESTIVNVRKKYDFIIIDTPGMTLHNYNNTIINLADNIICPLNESFIDLEALKYSLFFKELCLLKNHLVKYTGQKRNIILITTRRSPIISNHQEEFYKTLDGLKKNYNLDYIKGFFESVSFKEMFLNGLTTLDCNDLKITPSNIQRKSIESIKFYIKYILQKILTTQYFSQN